MAETAEILRERTPEQLGAAYVAGGALPPPEIAAQIPYPAAAPAPVPGVPTADYLRDKLPREADPATAGAPSTAPPVAPSPIVSAPGLMDRYADVIGQQKDIAQKRSDVAGAQIKDFQASLDAMSADIFKAAEAFRNTPTIPPAPALRMHDFLAPTGGETPENAIGKVIQALGLIGAGVRGMARSDATAALVGLRGALQGWQEGDAERAMREFREWQANSGRLISNWKMQTEGLEKWLSASNIGLAQKKAGIELELLNYGLQLDPLKIEQGGLEHIMQMIERHEALVSQLAMEDRKLRQQERQGDLTRQQRTDDMRERIEAANERMRFERASVERVSEMMRAQTLMIKDAERDPAVRTDYVTGQMRNPTVGEMRREPERFSIPITTQEQNLIGQLNTVSPIVNKVRYLGNKILAQHPVQNIIREFELRAQNKAAMNPDIREFVIQSEDLNIELAAALSRAGGMRVAMLKLMREVGPKLSDSKATLNRALDVVQMTVDNRIRTAMHMKPVEHFKGPLRAKVMKLDGSETRFVELGQGEHLPGEWVVMEEYK